VISGGVERLDAGRWRMWATVHAVESDMLLQRAEAEGTVRDSVLSAVIDRVSAVVATRLDMTVHWGKTLHRPTSLTALEQYQSAFEAVRAGDAAAGIARFRAAWRSDTAFVFAGIMAATNALAIDAYALGDSLLVALAPFEPGMLPLERQQLLRARALARADVPGTLAASARSPSWSPPRRSCWRSTGRTPTSRVAPRRRSPRSTRSTRGPRARRPTPGTRRSARRPSTRSAGSATSCAWSTRPSPGSPRSRTS
jgi:hypothetical protein